MKKRLTFRELQQQNLYNPVEDGIAVGDISNQQIYDLTSVIPEYYAVELKNIEKFRKNYNKMRGHLLRAYRGLEIPRLVYQRNKFRRKEELVVRRIRVKEDGTTRAFLMLEEVELTEGWEKVIKRIGHRNITVPSTDPVLNDYLNEIAKITSYDPERIYTTQLYLMLVLHHVDHNKYIPSSESGSTYKKVSEEYERVVSQIKAKDRETEEFVEHLKEEYKPRLDYLELKLSENRKESRYLDNLYKLIQTDVLMEKQLSFATDLGRYERENPYHTGDWEEMGYANEYLGEKGDYIQSEVVLREIKELGGHRDTIIYEFETTDGMRNKITIFSEGYYEDIEEGRAYTINGRVAGHIEYRGRKETTLKDEVIYEE